MSILVILIQGQQFGRDVALKWLRSLFVGIIEDCFLAYPLMVGVKFTRYLGNITNESRFHLSIIILPCLKSTAAIYITLKKDVLEIQIV